MAKAKGRTSIENDISRAIEHLESKQKDFDSVLTLTRMIVRDCSNSITLLHKGDEKGSEALLTRIRSDLKRLEKIDGSFKSQSSQAYQEYAEAYCLYGIVRRDEIPKMVEIGIEPEQYLLGLLDVVGELKREALEELRAGNYQRAEKYYRHMTDIYDSTRGLRFPDAVINGFRRKQDVARIQIEQIGSDLAGRASVPDSRNKR